jgi:hypothetical protein
MSEQTPSVWLTVQRGAWRCGKCKGEIGATLDKGFVRVHLPKACRTKGECGCDAELLITQPADGTA